MIFKLFWMIIFGFALVSCETKTKRSFVGIKMNPVYERDLTAWSLKNSLTITESAKWYPIKIYLGNTWRRADIKVRGDLSRHWKTPVKSFRVSLRGTEWKGMSEFDLIIPDDKGFELEAVVYEWASLLRLMVPYYEFIDVQLNHKRLGTYFLLERWSDSSFFNRGITSGEIIGENNAWLNVLDPNLKSLYKNVSSERDGFNLLSLEPAIYRAFKQRTQSQIAMTKFSKMLAEMKTGKVSWAKYIDQEASAKWAALLIYVGSIHGSFGDNVRWIYSSEDQKFSPIVYDVLFYPRNLKGHACLSGPFVKANAWISLWMDDPYMKERVSFWYDRITRDPDVNFENTWNMVQKNFYLENWDSVQIAHREEIKSVTKNNILKGLKFMNEGGCL